MICLIYGASILGITTDAWNLWNAKDSIPICRIESDVFGYMKGKR